MANINNIGNLTLSQIEQQVNQGASFRVFPYVISILIMTFNRNTDIYFMPPDEKAIRHIVVPFFTTLALGWWGIPWGPIYSIGALYHNLSGGKDVTQEVLQELRGQAFQASGTYGVPNSGNQNANSGGNYNVPNSNSPNSGSPYNVPNNGSQNGGSQYNIR